MYKIWKKNCAGNLRYLRKKLRLSYWGLAKAADIRIDRLILTEIPFFAGSLMADVVMDLIDFYGIEPEGLFMDDLREKEK